LIVLRAVPVPPMTEPVILRRDVALAAHLPLVPCVANLTFAFVVPLFADHLMLMFSVPDLAPVLVNVPVPVPPTAAAGVQPDRVALILPLTVYVVSFVHLPGWVTAADAGVASTPIGSMVAAASSRAVLRKFTVLLL
jgi:hypothetical protein